MFLIIIQALYVIDPPGRSLGADALRPVPPDIRATSPA
jgi:hypothetical protein